VLGVPDEVIVADYAATKENLEAIIERLMATRSYETVLSNLPPDTLHAEAETMQAFLERIRATYGDMHGYAVAAGVAPDALEALVTRLVETVLEGGSDRRSRRGARRDHRHRSHRGRRSRRAPAAPPPPPSRGARSRASLTLIARPCNSLPSSSRIARCASSFDAISTNPNPRERPDSRSVMTCAEVVSPI